MFVLLSGHTFFGRIVVLLLEQRSSIVCSVTSTVTCDSRPLRIIFKLPLREAEDTFKANTSYSLISALLSLTIALLSYFFVFHPIHIKQFIAIQFASYLLSRLVSSSLDTIVLCVILYRIYEFVFHHCHRILPICTPEFVYLHTTKSHTPICTRISQHSTNSYIQFHPATRTTKSHIQICTKYQHHTIL